MLSPLQEQVARIVAGLEEAEGFALAGGAALIARGEVHRQTRDLDFFGPTTDAVDRLVPALDRALRDAGLVVHHVQENPGFARLIVESGDDRTELDLGADARLFPVEPGEPAPMLSGEELAVDKVLALFGRAEARDFVDLMAVEPRYGLDRLCDLAVEKDRGFDLGVFAGISRGSIDSGGTSSTSTMRTTSGCGVDRRSGARGWSSSRAFRNAAEISVSDEGPISVASFDCERSAVEHERERVHDVLARLFACAALTDRARDLDDSRDDPTVLVRLVVGDRHLLLLVHRQRLSLSDRGAARAALGCPRARDTRRAAPRLRSRCRASGGRSGRT